MSKLCSFSHFRWSNTQVGKAGEASQTEKLAKLDYFLQLFLYILSVFLTADAPDICDPPCPIYEN